MKIIFSFALLSVLFFSCSKKASDPVYSVNTNLEITQQVGETMAALDESGGAKSGDLTKSDFHNYEKSFARIAHDEAIKNPTAWNTFLPQAIADSCSNADFGTCNAVSDTTGATVYEKTRNLTGCTTVAGGNISGDVALIFRGSGMATCTIPSSGDTTVRTATIGINGLRGAVFGMQNVSANGQTMTRTSASGDYTYSDSGTTRTFTDPTSTQLLNLTSSTSVPLVIAGATRNARTISGGTITIVNHLNSVSCDFTPTGVTWTGSCNCPTSGSWAATCSDATTMNIAFSGTCGQVTLTTGVSTTSTVILDRCE
ncbi:MAG: hypothetical protein ACXWQQ_03390 [Pseudobdellovibrio sp.]